MSNLVNFPTRQSTPTQAVRNGEVWYVYYCTYQLSHSDPLEYMYFWAKDDLDARMRLKAMFFSAEFGGKMQDHIKPQSPNAS